MTTFQEKEKNEYQLHLYDYFHETLTTHYTDMSDLCTVMYKQIENAIARARHIRGFCFKKIYFQRRYE